MSSAITVAIMIILCAQVWVAFGQSTGYSVTPFFPSPDNGAQLSNVMINEGQITASVAAKTEVVISLDYTIVSTQCPRCRNQIQYGIVNSRGLGRPESCFYDDLPGEKGVQGQASLKIKTPAQAGTYYLAFDWAQAS